MKRVTLPGWHLTLFCLMGSMSAWAGDVVLDNFTIGNLADDTALTPANSIFDIQEQLGQRFADNLFHSFFSFNIDNGETALFSGDPAIQNIVSRVTGGDPSTIDGIVRSTIDGAGFWFINPAGMIIDSNAVFDVSGSLALGAADFVEFENAERWYAFAPPAGATSTFSVAAPATFGFLDASTAGTLSMSGFTLDELDVPDIDDIVIAGAAVELDASVLTTRASAEAGDGGDIRILGGAISLDNDTTVATVTDVEADAGDIDITGTDSVAASGTVIQSVSVTPTDPVVQQPGSGSTGDVTITGGTIELTESLVQTVTLSSLAGNTAGSVQLDARNDRLQVTRTQVSTSTSGATDSGTVSLTGSDVSLNDFTLIATSTDGTGDAGDIVISGTNAVTAQGNGLRFTGAAIASSSGTSANSTVGQADLGAAGNVTITGGAIDLADSGISATTASSRPGNAPAAVTLDAGGNPLRLSLTDIATFTDGANDSGAITLTGGDISLDNGTRISAATFGTGDASDIVITGTNSVTANMQPSSADPEALFIDSSSVTTTDDAVGQPGSGSAGNITITGGEIALADALITAATISSQAGNSPGSVTIDAQGNSLSLVRTSVAGFTFGATDAGAIVLRGSDISLDDFTLLETSTSGTGDAGDITITGTNSVTAEGNGLRFTGAAIRSSSDIPLDMSVGQSELGSAGNVTITGGVIDLADSDISATTVSSRSGNAPASITLDAGANSLRLTLTDIATFTGGANDAGAITLTGGDVSLNDGTRISAATFGTGDASDIVIAGTSSVTTNMQPSMSDAEAVVVDSSSATPTNDAVGQPGSGSAGNVIVTGGEIALSNAQFFVSTVSSQAGNSPGSVTIDAQDGLLNLIRTGISSATAGGTDAGAISLHGGDVSLVGGTRIFASTEGPGDGGDIIITGTRSVTATGDPLSIQDATRIDSNSATATGEGTDQLGSAGSVTITGGDIDLTGVVVSAATLSNQVGNLPASITLDAGQNRLFLSNAGISSSTFGASNAGSIILIGGDVSLSNGTIVAAEAAGSGDAGGVVVSAFEDLTLDRSGIGTRALQSPGGDIQLTADGRLTLRDSAVEASAGEDGDGGDVSATAGSFVLQRSGIFARADDGDGGAINLDVTGTDGVFIKDSVSQINADSDTGTAGEVTLNTPDTDINSAIRVQDVDLFEAPALTADACSPAAWETRSSLVVEDQGGLPTAPDGYLPGSLETGRSRETGNPSAAYIGQSGMRTAMVSSATAAGCR